MPCLCVSAGCVSDKVAQVGNLQQHFFFTANGGLLSGQRWIWGSLGP